MEVGYDLVLEIVLAVATPHPPPLSGVPTHASLRWRRLR